ncbi:MAG: 4Fe-4S binding protein [Myxococcales bacterium]|jgi:formate hydrogenlyase subunit 6/NADH:ubiquinone oxidoreductase subunit I|nr:4Fe-4S binding protein [Myxococcales bacterium]
MLRKIRVTLAALCFVLLTLLFLDFTGTLHTYLGWLARIQFVPAILALNLGVILGVILLTLLLGRVYCSVVCPLGVFQDSVSWLAARRRPNRFSYSPARHDLRYGALAIFVALFVMAALTLASLIEPYSAYGRIAASLLSPIYLWANNLLAYAAQRVNSYAFYSVDVVMKGAQTFVVALVTFVGISVLAWRHGRSWCNTICPVGTLLGALARFSLLKPRLDKDKCIHCGLCARRCKASCIDSERGHIDASRCVACMNCVGNCPKGAIRYGLHKSPSLASTSTSTSKPTQTPTQPSTQTPTDGEAKQTRAQRQNECDSETNGLTRRAFLSSVASLVALESTALAEESSVDGGLAPIVPKAAPNRETPIVPPGALGAAHLSRHCTGCQLCVSTCPNQILKPSTRSDAWMQPEVSYENGYCRPECTRCSSVCPTGAIQPVTVVEKASLQIGQAVWSSERCLVNTKGIRCGVCARHCPTGAIQMMAREADNSDSLKLPSVDPERCIGCGACENLCPARPMSAIYVEGRDRHREI